jgi:hypothetical protein
MQYKDIFEANKKNDIVLEGEVGKVAGIRLVKSRLQAFDKDGSSNHPFICYCKNQNGEYPVTICAYDNMAEDIIVTPLGGLGNDPLKQRGSIGLYVDGHGFYVSDDAVCIRGQIANSTISAKLSSLAPTNIGADLMFNDAVRSQKSAEGKAREIIPEYDYVKIYRYSASTTANTFTLKAKKGNGVAWVFGSGTGKVTAVSGNTSVATVSGATVTTAGLGVATFVITSNDNANIKTVVTIEVVDGAGTDIIA